MAGLLLALFLSGCFFSFVVFLWSHYRISAKERFAGHELAKNGEFIKVGEVDAHYVRKGKGKPLILIHGVFSSSFVWHKNIDRLSKGFDVIAVDLKGYGYSDKPKDGKYGRGDIREFVIGFMDALKVDKAIVVGHSWGGGIAIDLASRYPDRVEKLVLIDSTGYRIESSLGEWILRLPGVARILLAFSDENILERILKEWVFHDPELVNKQEVGSWMRPYYVRGSVQAALELLNYDFDVSAEIKNILQPTLIIWGGEDKSLPVEMAQRFKQDIRNAVLRVIPNCGHNPQEERPEEVNELIRRFGGQ